MAATAVTPVIRWPSEAIWEAVVGRLPGFTVEVLPEIDSTNSELMRRARAGQTEPVLLVAERQTAGRGRMGRQWHGAVGASLMFSLGLPLAPRDWSGLSLAVGLSVAESLDPGARSGLGLKWPNDLWLADRKLGGILIETAGSGAGGAQATRQTVIGVGLNVHPPPAEGLSTPAACLGDLHEPLDAPTALARVAPPLVRAVLAFAQAGFAPLCDRYAQRDVLKGRTVWTSDGLQGLALGVDASGVLRLSTDDGERAVNSSEVSVRPVGLSG